MLGVLIVVGVLLVFGCGLFVGQLLRGGMSPGAGGRSPTVARAPRALEPLPDGLDEDEIRDIEVFRRASASVVYVTSITALPSQ